MTYNSKVALAREGTLVLKVRITSSRGSSIETGRSTVIDTKSSGALKGQISMALTQAVFGHIRHIFGDDWSKYYSSSTDAFEDIFNDEAFSSQLIDYHYEYQNYESSSRMEKRKKPLFKYKRIKVRGKYYVQESELRNGRYLFSNRTRWSPTKKGIISNELSSLSEP